jgi:hypothetical protein
LLHDALWESRFDLRTQHAPRRAEELGYIPPVNEICEFIALQYNNTVPEIPHRFLPQGAKSANTFFKYAVLERPITVPELNEQREEDVRLLLGWLNSTRHFSVKDRTSYQTIYGVSLDIDFSNQGVPGRGLCAYNMSSPSKACLSLKPKLFAHKSV